MSLSSNIWRDFHFRFKHVCVLNKQIQLLSPINLFINSPVPSCRRTVFTMLKMNFGFVYIWRLYEIQLDWATFAFFLLCVVFFFFLEQFAHHCGSRV